MNNIIILCEENKNPIVYFVSVIEESIKWFLKSVYRGTIVYDDTIATQDIHGIHVNNVMSFSYNDTLGRLKVTASDCTTTEMEHCNSIKMLDENQRLIDFVTVLKEIEWVSPLAQCMVYPMLSKITDVTYIHFNTLSPDPAAPITYYIHNLLRKVFKGGSRCQPTHAFQRGRGRIRRGLGKPGQKSFLSKPHKFQAPANIEFSLKNGPF